MLESLIMTSALVFSGIQSNINTINPTTLTEIIEDPEIAPNEYGFPDSYSSSEHTQTYCMNHQTQNGFTFETRRCRTGYIHGEYIVMSPKRIGWGYSYLEYRFPVAINSIDVYLSHWRETCMEGLTSSTGVAKIQYFFGNSWVDQFDLLSNQTNLPVDRTNPTLYNVTFPRPVYRIRFYAAMNNACYNDSNRGRICIGNMKFYLSSYNMPLSGGEIDYNPSIWNTNASPSNIQENTNCYSYALNCVKNAFTNQYAFMQPGQGINNAINTSNIEYYCNHLSEFIALILGDSDAYNFEFQLIDKNTPCTYDCYKVAFTISTQPYYDYHWYRQNSDGYWSHKIGNTPVTNLDNSNSYIIDPESCNRGNYNYFVNYYSVRPLNYGF